MDTNILDAPAASVITVETYSSKTLVPVIKIYVTTSYKVTCIGVYGT
jgi:hypothetical protein